MYRDDVQLKYHMKQNDVTSHFANQQSRNNFVRFSTSDGRIYIFVRVALTMSIIYVAPYTV